MKTRFIFTIISLMSLISGAWAGDFNGSNYDQKVSVPGTFDLSYGTYTGFNRESFFSNEKKIENSKSNAKAFFTFTVSEVSKFLLSLEGSNGNGYGDYNCNLEIRIWAADGEEPTDATKTFTVEDNNNWNDFNAYYLFTDELAAGDYKLSIKWTDQANVQNIKMAAVGSSKYDVSNDEVSLMTNWKTKGVVNISNSTYSGYDNMEYTSAYDNVNFIINSQYDCDLDVAFQASTNNDDCSIKMTLVDEDGTVLGSETKNITKNGWSTWGDYATSSGISVSAGYKVLCIKFLGGGSNVKNLKVTPSNIVSGFKDIAIDLRSGQLGTEGSGLSKYLTIDGETYNYADEEPANYNALLSASSFNGSQHGYVGLTANIPVEAGIYKLTVGTCQYNNGALAIKNSSDVAQTIYDEDGQSHTSFSASGTCDNSTVGSQLYHTSIWYQAENDETIKVVFDTYTPYFSIESVNSVPELKYIVTYANNTADVEGTVPGVAYATAGNSVTLPVNRTLYKDGYTLTGWSDGNTTYEPGDSYTPTANVTLNAVFTQNTYSFDQTVSEMTVRWDFQRQNGCPTITKQGASAILVQQADVNGNTIDMKMDINATSGTFDNGSWNDWAQVNEGATFSFPSVEGTTVKAYSMYEPKNNSDVKSSVDGNEYSSYASYVATYATTPTSNSSTLTVKGVMGDTYYRYIDVTYPAAAITGITELTVDGVAVGSEIIAAINNGDAYTATLSGNTYTTVPAVEATFDTSAQATGVASGTGTSRTYTINDGVKDYTLVVEGIHIYEPTGGETSIDIKMNEGTVTDNVWTNGIYTMTTTGIGSSGGADFKFDANTDAPYTISIPADVVVKQFIIKNFHANYSGGDGQLKTVTSTDATTYIPTKHNCVYSGQTTADNRTYEGPAYDLVVTVEDHVAGTPIVFTMKKSAQPMGWIQLTTVTENPGTAPVKTGESVAVVNNHAAVSVTFDREIPNDVTATINESSVTAEGGATTLVFPVWDLSYSTNYTLTIPANSVEDAYGNKNSSAINIAVNVPAKPAVSPAAYDYVVSDATELLAALDAIQSTNQNDKNATRKTVFLKNGDYDLGSSNETVRWVRSHNLSLIGESRDGVVIHGTSDGISNPVLNLRYWQGFYLQDLTVRNDKNYGLEDKNGVAVAIYGGDKTIMKNVRMQSNQDTQVTGDRAYFEDCKIHGTVDFICGGGDNFYYHTDLILENRGGNVIVAPSTSTSNKWGYVFQECTIKGVDDAAAATNAGSYYLGRPWQNEPQSYFLNTTMHVLPATAGWTGMSTLLTHFYEYNSMDANGDALDLSGRTNSPTSTNTYTPVLTSGEAAKYTLENVLGGTDSWLPTDYTYETAAPVVSASGNTISWAAVDDARCYVIFKDGEYLANQTATSYDITSAGVYTVRAANEMGGLGATSNAVVSGVITPAGWSSFASSYPLDLGSIENGTAYYASAAGGETVTLTPTGDVSVPAGEGIMVKGTADDVFTIKVAASGTAIDGNLLKGQTTTGTVTASGAGTYHYVFGYESSSVYGFYNLASDTTVPAGKAYLETTGGNLARALRFSLGGITDIEQIDNGNIEGSLPVKRIVNGKLVIEKKGHMFNANGQLVK